MLIAAALASVGLALCALNVEAAASHEYVRINRGNSQLAANSTREPHIQIKDEGLVGVQYKPYPLKKSDSKPPTKDILGVKASIKDEGTTGLLKKSGVSSIKHLEIDEEVVPTKKDSKKKIKRDEGGLDFDDDENPLANKKLKPSATAQASRVNVKKGPNGQDYEYEYVYYYYDDEDDKADGSAGGDAKTVAVTPAAKVAAEAERGSSSQTRHRGAVETETEPSVAVIPESTPKTRQHNRGEAVSQPQQPVEEVDESEEEPAVQPSRRRQENRGDDRSSTRYTTIERGRPTVPVEPSVNEVVPSRGSSRSRGRQQAQVSDPTVPSLVEDERLPQSNARFPSRGRGNGAAAAAVTTIQTPVASQSGSRSRNSGGATIRRPSLVDSSSFRTHSSDVAPDADQGKYYEDEAPVNKGGNAYLPEDPTRPTTFTPSQTTSPAPPLPPLPEQPPETGMPDKAALDLYAILQQTQEENSVSGTGSELGSQDLSDAVTTELLTTMMMTTTTTTTTTTTPEPTTTTTTTTTTPQPSLASGRGRFRTSNIGGGRTRLRPGSSSSTTTTEEAPKDDSAPARRNKFQPSRTHSPSSGYSSGRRGGARTSTTAAAPAAETETSTARVRSSFGAASGNRYRSRGRTTAAPAPQAEEDQSDTQQQQQSTTAAPASRPTRPRLNVSAATRPLRPGPRINLRSRAGLSTTAAPAPSQAAEEAEAPVATTPPPAPQHHEEEHPASSSPAPGDALSRLKNRPRLKVLPRAQGSATGGSSTASQSRPLPHGIKRRPLPGSAAAPVEQPAQEASTEGQPENEQPAEQPAQTEPPSPSTAAPAAPHSNLLRRRPNIRRLQVPHSTAS